MDNAATDQVENERELNERVMKERREQFWRYKCPKLFREEFEIARVPVDVSRDNVKRILSYQFG